MPVRGVLLYFSRVIRYKRPVVFREIKEFQIVERAKDFSILHFVNIQVFYTWQSRKG